MNNFELDDQCKSLVATKTNYTLAKELILAKELNREIFTFVKACGELSDDFSQEDTYLYERARIMSYKADELLTKMQEAEL